MGTLHRPGWPIVRAEGAGDWRLSDDEIARATEIAANDGRPDDPHIARARLVVGLVTAAVAGAVAGGVILLLVCTLNINTRG